MERIWLKVDRLELYDFHRKIDFNGKKIEGAAYATLRLGDAFIIPGIEFYSRPGEEWFSQNWAMASARLLDVPFLHRRNKKNPLLDYELSKALADFCRGENGRDIREFVEGSPEVPPLTVIRPAGWKGLSLRIPVDFIRIRNFSGQKGDSSAYADIQVGHHMIFWRLPVWDARGFVSPEKTIPDKRVVAIINLMLRQKKFRQHIESMVKFGFYFRGEEFVEKVPRCDTESVPPAIRFY